MLDQTFERIWPASIIVVSVHVYGVSYTAKVIAGWRSGSHFAHPGKAGHKNERAGEEVVCDEVVDMDVGGGGRFEVCGLHFRFL